MHKGKLIGWTAIIILPVLFIAVYLVTHQHYRQFSGEFPVIPEKFKGRNWVAVFVRAQCKTCRNLLGDLSRLLQHHPTANLPLLVLSLDSPQHIFRFQSAFSLPFTVYACNSYITRPLAVKAVPDIFYIDSNGKIIRRWKGKSALTDDPNLILEFLEQNKIPTEKSTGDQTEYALNNNHLEISDSSHIQESFFSGGENTLTRNIRIIPECDCEEKEKTFYLTVKTISRLDSDQATMDTLYNLTMKDVSTYIAKSRENPANPDR